jgi:N-methylhydantoinase A/oxoprolinase/acetone carboxylase beta subunit
MLEPIEVMRVATDVGGTFTDLVYFYTDDKSQQIIGTAKVNTIQHHRFLSGACWRL